MHFKHSIGVVQQSLLLILVAAMLSGCAASRALNKPAPKNLAVLEPGTSRDLVRAELGEATPSVGPSNCDVFVFREGSGGWKYFRAVTYSVFALATLGISEIVTNPIEEAFGNDKKRVRVCYTNSQQVIYAELLRIGQPPKLLSGHRPAEPAATDPDRAAAGSTRSSSIIDRKPYELSQDRMDSRRQASREQQPNARRTSQNPAPAEPNRAKAELRPARAEQTSTQPGQGTAPAAL